MSADRNRVTEVPVDTQCAKHKMAGLTDGIDFDNNNYVLTEAFSELTTTGELNNKRGHTYYNESALKN